MAESSRCRQAEGLLVDEAARLRARVESILAASLDMDLVGEVSGKPEDIERVRELIERVQELMPDIVLMDVKLPRLPSIGVAEVRRAFPNVSIVMLTDSDQEPGLIEAMRAGAEGFVVLGNPPQEVAHTLHSVLERRRRSHLPQRQ